MHRAPFHSRVRRRADCQITTGGHVLRAFRTLGREQAQALICRNNKRNYWNPSVVMKRFFCLAQDKITFLRCCLDCDRTDVHSENISACGFILTLSGCKKFFVVVALHPHRVTHTVTVPSHKQGRANTRGTSTADGWVRKSTQHGVRRHPHEMGIIL